MSGDRSYFTEYKNLISEVDNSFLKKARDRKEKIIAYTCSYVPEALLNVEGLHAYRACAPGVQGTEMADTYLSNVICSYTRSLLETTLDFRYEHIDGWVSAVSCDHIRRFYDNHKYLNNPAFLHILDLPNKSGVAAIDWYEEELRVLAEKLSAHFGVDTGTAALNTAIKKRNQLYSFLRKIGDLRKQKNVKITGTEYQLLLKTAVMIPVEDFFEITEGLYEFLKNRETIQNYKIRVMLLGSELDDSEYLNIIEKSNALIVADRYGNGSIPGVFPIENNTLNPYRALAKDKLQKIPSPRMIADFESRVKLILDTAKEYQVDAIILQTMKFCDLWSTERVSLLARIKEAAYPVLNLEREYSRSGEGQLRTRIQAFIESMGK